MPGRGFALKSDAMSDDFEAPSAVHRSSAHTKHTHSLAHTHMHAHTTTCRTQAETGDRRDEGERPSPQPPPVSPTRCQSFYISLFPHTLLGGRKIGTEARVAGKEEGRSRSDLGGQTQPFKRRICRLRVLVETYTR